MWDIKNLLIGILFGICALSCFVAFFFKDGGNFGKFSLTGMIMFAFISLLFIKNARR